MSRNGLFFIAALAVCGMSHAKDCSQQHNPTTACLTDTLKTRNAEMVSAYNALHDATKAKTELEDSQSSWSTYRDRQCGEFLTKNADTPATQTQSQACRLTLTTERLQLLKTFGKGIKAPATKAAS